MGFGSLVSKGLSAASKVKSAVKSVKKGLKAIKSVADLTGLTYRNSLLYDFSSVVRARIYVFEYNSVKKDVAERFRLIDNLPVQINPDEYYRRKSNGYVMNLGEAKKTGEVPSGDSMDFILKFNIVDEYKLMTRDGLYPIPLNLDEVTIISKLFEYKNKNSDHVVLFKWGPLAYLSNIVEVSCKYESFSPYGEPLSANVDLKLAKFKETVAAENEDVVDALGTANWAIIKGTDVAETVSGVVKSADAYSETLPNIARRI